MRKIALLAFGLVFVLVVTAVHSAASTIENNDTYLVEQGDTLWAIAQRFAPRTMDIRDYIYRLRKINNLRETATIHPGQVLVLPMR